MKTIRKKIIILVSLASALFLIILFLVILPLTKRITNENKNIYDNRVALEIANQQKSDTATTQKNYDKIIKDLDELDKIFIKDKTALQFIDALEKTADAAGVTQEINLSDKKEMVGSFKKVPISLTITGDYRNIIKYLSQLETLDYYISFNLLNFSSLQNETVLRVDGTTYWK